MSGRADGFHGIGPRVKRSFRHAERDVYFFSQPLRVMSGRREISRLAGPISSHRVITRSVMTTKKRQSIDSQFLRNEKGRPQSEAS